MKYSLKLSALATSALLAGQALAADFPAISVKGSKFFYENGTQFFMKGVAYQQEFGAAGAGSSSTKYVDPLANESACKRDIPYLQKLGTNVIRTYAIDPTADHEFCMNLLQKAGIYVISDLSEPKLSIESDNPQWTTDIYKRYTDVIDELAKYPNVIGFFAGNEVSNQVNNTAASAYVKAAVRDSKKHIKDKGYPFTVGYATNDDEKIRIELSEYFNCGDPEEAIDFWGYNIYSWCGKSTMEDSGFDKQVEFFKEYSVPVFFAEYGCIKPNGGKNRIFEETTALYSKDMTGVFSGGIVYMYFQEDNDYGLVEVDGDKVTPFKAFSSLSSRVHAATPSAVQEDDYSPTNSPKACPTVGGNWAASSNLPPSPDSELCDCMYSQLTCVPSDDLDEKDFEELFGNVCGTDGEPCVGINGSAKSGLYGAYSMCSPKQKLGYALNAYYTYNNKKSTACDFQGQAKTTTAAKADSSCASKLEAAKATNSAVKASKTPGSSGSSDDENAAGSLYVPSTFQVGDLAIGVYALMSMFAGAGILLL